MLIIFSNRIISYKFVLAKASGLLRTRLVDLVVCLLRYWIMREPNIQISCYTKNHALCVAEVSGFIDEGTRFDTSQQVDFKICSDYGTLCRI